MGYELKKSDIVFLGKFIFNIFLMTRMLRANYVNIPIELDLRFEWHASIFMINTPFEATLLHNRRNWFPFFFLCSFFAYYLFHCGAIAISGPS